MKRLQKLLAVMLTVFMCAGTVADTGFTVFAADGDDAAVEETAVAAEDAETEEEAVVEEAAEAEEEEAVVEEAAEAEEEEAVAEEAAEAEAIAEEDEDVTEEEPVEAPYVKKLVVNGTNMLAQGKANNFLKPNGDKHSGHYSDTLNKPYMMYNSETGVLTLHDITLDGNFKNTSGQADKTPIGIDFEGNLLTIEVIGDCTICPAGIDGEDSYGIRVGDNSNLTITSTVSGGKRVYGALYISPDSNNKGNWMASIFCKGNLKFETPKSDEGQITDFEASDYKGLFVNTNPGERIRSGSGGEIQCKSDLTISDAVVWVYASGTKANGVTFALDCSDRLNINSGYVDAAIDSYVTEDDSSGVAIRAGLDIYIGENALVNANGYMSGYNKGRGISSIMGQITVKGELWAYGKDMPIYAGGNAKPCIKLDGTAVYSPDEGKVDDDKKTITEADGKLTDSVVIKKGEYRNIWVGGRRLGTWDTDLSIHVSPAYTAEMYFDPDTNTLTMNKVTDIAYYPGGPSEPSNKALIYSEEPLHIRGNAKLQNETNVIWVTKGSYLDIEGDFELKSKKANALYVGGAKLFINGEDTVLKAESEEGRAINCGMTGAGFVLNNGTVSAKGKDVGIYCDGIININGGELTAEGGKYALEAYNKRFVDLADGITVVEPAGGKEGTVQEGTVNIGTIVDKNGNAATKVKLTDTKYDLWLGSTRVTSVNKYDILGDETAIYDPDSRTLTLDNPDPIPGYQTVSGVGNVQIYSKHALNIRGKADIDAEYNAILIEADILEDPSTIEGNFSITSGAGGVLIPQSVLVIQGEGTTLTTNTPGVGIECYSMAITNATADLTSTGNGAILANAAVALESCELTVTGQPTALAVMSKEANALTWTDDMEIVEPEDGKKSVYSGMTVVMDAENNLATSAHFGAAKEKVTVSVEAVDRTYEEGNIKVELKNAKLSGVAKGDEVNVDLSAAKAIMYDDYAAENKPVLISGIKLSGKDADKYKVVQPTDVTVNIAKAEWTQTTVKYVVKNTDIGKELHYNLLVPEFCAPGAYADKAEADKKKNQLDGEPTLKAGGKELVVTIKSGTPGKDIETVIRLSMTGAMNHKDYTLEMTLVGEHDHTEDLMTLVEKVEPGCETEGVEEHYICKLCGKLFTYDGTTYHETTEGYLRIAALGHDWDEDLSEIIVYPTTTTDGLRRVHCARKGCAKYKEVVIPKNTKVHRPSPMNPVPENLEIATKLTVVKGQSFTIPGSGWKCVEKADKKYVSVSKKGKFKAKKVTEAGVVAKITDGNRTIEVTVVQPAFSDKSVLKLEAKGTLELASLGFSSGSADLDVWYTSSAPDVVAVYDDGAVWAMTAGTSTITAYVNGKAYTRKVKVTEPTPLAERFIHATVNVKKNLKVKGFNVAQWTVAEADKENLEINKTSVKALKKKESTPGYYYLIGVDKEGHEICGVKLIVEDPVIEDPAIIKKGTNKYEINTDVNTIVYLPIKGVEQLVTFKSSKGIVAYADYNDAGKLTVYAQSKGKCKLSTKINGKTITITVNVK